MQINLEDQFAQIIRDYRDKQFESIQKSLDVAADWMVTKLESASPIGNSSIHFRDQWEVKRKYPNVRYIGNAKMTKESPNFRSVPLSNILEHGRKGRPFIKRTYNANKAELFSRFKNELERRLK